MASSFQSGKLYKIIGIDGTHGRVGCYLYSRDTLDPSGEDIFLSFAYDVIVLFLEENENYTKVLWRDKTGWIYNRNVEFVELK